MKVLRIEYEGLRGFIEGKICVDLMATGRVREKGAMEEVGSNIFSLPAVALAGINASGKTTLLRLIFLALGIVCQRKSLHEFPNFHCMESVMPEGSVMRVTYVKDMCYQLTVTFGWQDGDTDDGVRKCIIREEVLRSKSLKSMGSRKKLFVFSDSKNEKVRSNIKKKQKFLEDDTSIAKYYGNEDGAKVFFDWESNDYNFITTMGQTPNVVLRAFDNNIATLARNDEKDIWTVKFNNSDIKYSSNTAGLNYLISSGTIKGQNLVQRIYNTLHSGGYLLVDELENHLNKELVRILIEFFTDPKLNRFGATLIFSTHYAEILDCMDRMDNIYFCQKEPRGIKVVKYADCKVRGELKKSEVFSSSYCGGTAPLYENIKSLKEFIWSKN